MPIFLAHEEELKELDKCRYEQPKPAAEFLERLYQLYAFALGAAFFEMGTKMSLKKFIFIQYFSLCMQKDGAPQTSVDQLWEKARTTKDKKMHQLMDILMTNIGSIFLE